MCGIAGVVSMTLRPLPSIGAAAQSMGEILKHRGPDDSGAWRHEKDVAAFSHRRLSIIDVRNGRQPMRDEAGNCIVFNGEIYNYQELREEIGGDRFRTGSDTEVILRSYSKWGAACVSRLRGMFSFAIWDERESRLFCARDRFGIKPFYYAENGPAWLFASEQKALLPFVDEIGTNMEALRDYLVFQFCLPGETLFKGVHELPAAHTLTVDAAGTRLERYWDLHYVPDFDHTERYFEEKLDDLLNESVRYHLVSDVPVGAYVSGGIDSSLVATMGAGHAGNAFCGFNGKFSQGPEFDESEYAHAVAGRAGFALHVVDIEADDFSDNIEKIIYHLDCPVAGPGSFPQYMVSKFASRRRKVVLGGQGGDEIFGGYTRYLVAYFEQCIRAAIDGTMDDGNFVVTYESIIPNLKSLRNYKGLLQEFWRDEIFAGMDRRYFRLVNRSSGLADVVDWDALPPTDSFERFGAIFNSGNAGKESYFDLMTHFDFKTLLPALLQVEDRMSMAHGLETRVPLLDHPLVEMTASLPADVKFRNGDLKHVLKAVARRYLPPAVTGRVDKMGFPTPLNDWIAGPLGDFVRDVFSSSEASTRGFVRNGRVVDRIGKEGRFARNLWGLLSLEIWHRQFHDRAADYRRIRRDAAFNP